MGSSRGVVEKENGLSSPFHVVCGVPCWGKTGRKTRSLSRYLLFNALQVDYARTCFVNSHRISYPVKPSYTHPKTPMIIYSAVFKTLLLVSAASTATVLPAQVIFSDDFETYTEGTDLDGQGGWTASGTDVDTSLTVSDAEAYTGSQSLSIVDDSTGARPSVLHSLSETVSHGEFSFAVKEATGVDFWTVQLGNFKFSRISNKLTVIYTVGTDKYYPGNVTFASAGYSTTDWNAFSILFDGATGSLDVSLNGDNILSVDDEFYEWSTPSVELGMYFSGDTSSAFFDTVSMNSIPEPSSYAQMLGVTALALCLLRRSRRQ